jgi:nucleoside-diphosphate-sugar epimerase
MKVLVTGSEGFIGKAVLSQLEREGAEIVGLDIKPATEVRPAVRHAQCDILDADALNAVFDRERPDAVLHLAARTDLDETAGLEGYAANVEGVRNVVAAVRKYGVKRAVYTSTQLVCKIGYKPTSPEDYCPTTVYGRSKVLTEQIVRADDGGGATWCLIRPTSVWGPGMNDHYRGLLTHIQRGRYFHIGSEERLKSYGYVGNVAYQCCRLLDVEAEKVRGRTLFVADYEPLGVRRYVDALGAAMGAPRTRTLPTAAALLLARAGDALNLAGWRSFPFNTFRVRNIMTEYILDIEPTRELCGPVPFTFEQGIDKTIAWFLGAARVPDAIPVGEPA